MSHPQRYPNPSHRYPAPRFPVPRPGPPFNPAIPWSAAVPAGVDGLHLPSSAYARPEEAHGYTPSTQRAPWTGLPRDLQLDAEYERLYLPGGPHAYGHYWLNYPPPPLDPDASRRAFLPMEHYGNQLDQQQRRLKWREEILKGDPDKAIADSLPESSRLVVSLITRGPLAHPYGQGDELLSFRAVRRANNYQTTSDWTYFALDASALFPMSEGEVIPSAAELSKRSLTGLLPKLDFDKDLKLVRKSKPLLWDNASVLETFLYRIVEDKEDPESEAGRALAERLGGPPNHVWNRISDIRDVESSTGDLISTALISVYLPHALSLGLDNILADQLSRADQLSLKALDVLYLCIQGRYARTCFHYYPIPPPPVDQKDYELCHKRRAWAYWTEVMAWHLCNLREDAQVSTTYVLLKALSAVKPSVDDIQVTLDDLDQIMINAIATEADRSRNVARNLMQEGISECLYNAKFAPSGDPLDKMHIVTAGTSSIVYHVIAKIITHVLSRRTNPLVETTNKSIVNRRILDLKITIAESRPLAEGVALAVKLSRVVDSYTEYRDRSSKSAKRNSGVPSATELGPAALDTAIQARLRQTMMESEQLGSPLKFPPHSLGLSHLLANFDAKKEKKDPKVTIELITDAAVVSTIIAASSSGVKPFVLLGADRILADGTAVNKVGSSQMAWAAKSSGGFVLILCRADRVHPKNLPVPAKPTSPSDQLIPGWKSTIEEPLDEFLASSHVSIINPTFENISHEHITGYITELGFMDHALLTEFSNMRGDLDGVVWPVNILTK